MVRESLNGNLNGWAFFHQGYRDKYVQGDKWISGVPLGDRPLGQAARILTATASVESGPRRLCGTLPGDGFFSYTKTVGIACQVAQRLVNHVSRRFCRGHDHCFYRRNTSPLHVFKGPISYRGWACHVKVGYEMTMVRCRKARLYVYHHSAA